jgi:hypothetical protein
MGVFRRQWRRVVVRPAKRTVRRKVRPAVRRVSVTCSCGKRYTDPLTHTCTVRTDFAKRRAAAERKVKSARKAEKRRERRQKAAERKREAAARRKAAAKERKATAKTRAPRPRPPAHDYQTCTDPQCEKYGCVAYRQGLTDCEAGHRG